MESAPSEASGIRRNVFYEVVWKGDCAIKKLQTVDGEGLSACLDAEGARGGRRYCRPILVGIGRAGPGLARAPQWNLVVGGVRFREVKK